MPPSQAVFSVLVLLVQAASLLLPTETLASTADIHLRCESVGALLGGVWTLPFAGMLLSIAVMPLALPHFWERHYGKVAAFWALAFLAPFALVHGFDLALFQTAHTILSEYVPFLILLLTLFTIAGGVCLTGTLVGRPVVNTAFLLAGTLLASWMGTTGAAMLLIRPLLRANAARVRKTHTVVFFIFLVANIGGCLTPLGDPPLFLGFLKGVSFFWTTSHLFAPFVLTSALLLGLYFVLDSWLYAREPGIARNDAPRRKLAIEGKGNLVLLLFVVLAVLLSGVWKPDAGLTLLGVRLEAQNLLRDAALLALTGLSLRYTDEAIRRKNAFDWGPMQEVGKLFAGIFLSMIPAIAILKAGPNGALAPLVSLVSAQGHPVPAMYFWLSGALSSFLDNAPTYLVFFNTAGGDAETLMNQGAVLAAVSAGSVFMGANSYIGNAPNFMVRSIAESNGVKMPSFFGYMLWSVGTLVPCFVLLTALFFSK